MTSLAARFLVIWVAGYFQTGLSRLGHRHLIQLRKKACLVNDLQVLKGISAEEKYFPFSCCWLWWASHPNFVKFRKLGNNKFPIFEI